MSKLTSWGIQYECFTGLEEQIQCIHVKLTKYPVNFSSHFTRTHVQMSNSNWTVPNYSTNHMQSITLKQLSASTVTNEHWHHQDGSLMALELVTQVVLWPQASLSTTLAIVNTHVNDVKIIHLFPYDVWYHFMRCSHCTWEKVKLLCW